MTPTKKSPLFLVTGASCAGKSTACDELFKLEKNYIVLESDILWNDFYNTPRDDYKRYRTVWLNLCANISQIGLPCVVCGCCTPKQFEYLNERSLFTEIHYLAVVCDDDTMLKRITEGRKISDDEYIKSSMDFNNWLKKNYSKTSPAIELLDTSNITPKEAAERIDTWINKKLSIVAAIGATGKV